MRGLTGALGSAWRRLAMLARGGSFDRELEEEMRLHRELRELELRAGGAEPAVAAAEAERSFGSLLRLREDARDAWGWRRLDELGQDLRSGLRALRRSPAFGGAAILALGVGIGACTAVFGVLWTVLIRPLPYTDASRLVFVNQRSPQGDRISVSYPDFVDWRARQRALTDLGLFQRRVLSFTGAGGPAPLRGAVASAGVFTVLGWQAQLGRVFADADDFDGAEPVAVLGDALWKERFAADPAVLGRRVTLNGKPTTIVGVLPAVAPFPSGTELWLSFGSEIDPATRSRGSHAGWYALGRLAAGTTVGDAGRDLGSIAGESARLRPTESDGSSVEVRSLRQRVVGQNGTRLAVLAGAAALALVAICASLGGLLLARGSARTAELAVRQVLGAGHGRIVRQLLTENLVLALGGGLAGLTLAPAVLRSILLFAPPDADRFQAARIDWLAVAFALALAAATAVFFGAWPAWRLSQAAALPAARRDRCRSDGGRLRWTLTALQVAVALTILLGTLPLFEELARCLAKPLGFDPSGVVQARIDASVPSSPGRPSLEVFGERLVAGVRSLSGVVGATLNTSPPGRAIWQSDFGIEGLPNLGAGARPRASISTIEPSYFEVMRIPLLAGRTFGVSERGEEARVVVVDEALARRYWPHGGALGKGLLLGPGTPRTVVGIAASVRLQGYEPVPSRLQIYLPPTSSPALNPTLLVRSALSPSVLAARIGALARRIDPDRLVFDFQPLVEDLESPLRIPQMVAGLGSCLALLALALAGLGLYAIVAYAIHRRRLELGIRMALGAAPQSILRLALGEAAASVVAGTALGGLAGLLTRHLLSGRLPAPETPAPGLLLAAPLLLYALALSICLIPAARAGRQNAAAILRAE